MRNIKLFISLLAFAFLVDSCSKDEIVYPEANVEVAKTYLSLDQLVNNPVEVSSEAGTYVLKVVSDKKWKVTSSEEWCTLSTKEGFKYVEVPINFSDNPWNIDRTAQLTFTVSETEESYTLNLKQIAAETKLTADLSELVYSVGGGEQTVSLKTNANDWSLQIIDPNATEAENVSWFTSSVYSGQGSMDIKFTASGNDTKAIRNAKIVFTAEDKTLEIPVEQLEKFNAPVIKLDDVTFNLTWDKIVGVNYELKIFKSAEGSEAVGLDEEGLPGDAFITQDFPQNTTSCDLSKFDWEDYIGKIKIQLSATMTINDKDITLYSNVIEAHNYFDMSSGEGAEDSPYIISNVRHLKNIGSVSGTGKIFKQTQDIVLSDENFTPLCPDGFYGTFDGDNKVISGLKINTSSGNVGLFAKINGSGKVNNVILNDVLITALGTYTGAIAAESEGEINGCKVSGNITSSEESTAKPVGGIVGYNTNKIVLCLNNIIIDVKSKSIGGICGKSQGGFIEQCGNNCDIISIKPNVGGIVGEVTQVMTIKECFNKGNIKSMQSVGGIVGGGNNASEVNNCYNIGVIESTGGDDKSKACGIYAWSNANHPTIENCYNVGNVIVPNGKISNAISNQAPAGNITNCFFLTGTAVNKAGNIQGSGTDESAMKQQATYTNWDFDTVWTMSSETGYPKLKWEN